MNFSSSSFHSSLRQTALFGQSLPQGNSFLHRLSSLIWSKIFRRTFPLRSCGRCISQKDLLTVQGSVPCNSPRSSCRVTRSKKEVFQPHLPVRLPCYDLAPVTSFALGRSSRSRTSGAPGFHGLTGGVYKARERIHRAMADARLLANPTSWSRVADSNPNYDRFSRFASYH